MRERKSYKLEIKEVTDEGEFVGYASVFGIVDLQGDVVDKGAFAQTLRHKNGRVPLLADHDPRARVGVAYLEEDNKGLLARGVLNLEKQSARELLADIRHSLKHGVPLGLSIGFDTIKEQWVGGVRHLKEIRLWEVSVVTFPANEEARIVESKAVVPFQDLPLADLDRPWDRDAAEARVRRWAGGPEKENIDWSKYRKAFVWYDPDDAENFRGYKLPIADVIDGELRAVPRAIFAAAAVIQGARGGVDIPESDIPAVKRHLARYYRKMDRTPPWESEEAAFELALYAIIGAREAKVGRVLSAANRRLVEQAIEALQALLRAADGEDEDAEKVQSSLDTRTKDGAEDGMDAKVIQSIRELIAEMRQDALRRISH